MFLLPSWGSGAHLDRHRLHLATVAKLIRIIRTEVSIAPQVQLQEGGRERVG